MLENNFKNGPFEFTDWCAEILRKPGRELDSPLLSLPAGLTIGKLHLN